MNRPPAVAIDFGSPESDIQSTSSLEFEHVGYPDHYQHQQHHHRAEETLPLHYMSEEKARRRVRPGGAAGGGGGVDAAEFNEKEQFEYQEYDDAGKDVYNKPRPYNGARISSGRLPAHPPPPPTSIVSAMPRTLSSWTRR
jgi:dolichyl-phosphate-mannose-protein mannosyltransferase